MNSESSKGIVTAVLGAAAVGGFLYYYFKKSSASKKPTAGKEDKAAPKKAPKLEKKRLIELFEKISTRIRSVADQLGNIYRQTEPSIKAGQVNKAEVIEYMKGEFEKALDAIEKNLYETEGVTEAEVQEAQDYYKDDEEFKPILENLRELYMSLDNGGPALPPLPDKFTKEKILTIVEESVDVTTKAMKEVLSEAKEKFSLTDETLKEQMKTGKKDDPLIAFILPKFTKVSESIKVSVHAKHDINEGLISAAIAKYQSDPEFMKELTRVTEKQRLVFEDMGLA